MNKYQIPNIIKACRILELLAENADGLSASDIEQMSEAARTTVYRILQTLCAQGMAEKRNGLFFAGTQLVKIGLDSLHSMEIRSLCVPFLRDLANKTGCTSHLAVPAGWQSLILEVHDSPNPVRVASRPGTTVPLYCSSTGKIFLAYIHKDSLKNYYCSHHPEKFTENTITTLEEMEKEVNKILENGCSVDAQEYHENVCCIAAPVKNGSREVCASIGITGPSSSLPEQRIEGISGEVTQCAEKLSEAMGYSRN
ncbi:YiaKLMNOPQRS operon repressor [Sedimentisphaera cyanobacteriorum]|uniref:YiaKLMNOPQRS operon repressor n=1 Tax=Sedimentisphaera cyanobacteriorum TaxID=1940790 RepID=A0A1Q2HMI3_9BACT|nr:IclR family transcriptional regulator [Sedimentisphaera cyanobacteriorum]AQQ08648.1 YiaKLMNOPQRS operon repressor [Sedimentisphaera cyanobacteriorum]